MTRVDWRVQMASTPWDVVEVELRVPLRDERDLPSGGVRQPPKLDAKKRAEVVRLFIACEMTVADIALRYGINTKTVYKYVRAA